MSQDLTITHSRTGMAATSPPAIVTRAGNAGQFAWDEFFSGQLRNRHTRAAYLHAVKKF